MNARERFNLTMAYAAADRVPWLDEGLRDGVVEAWRAEGLGPGADLEEMFGFDRRERLEIDLGFRPKLRRWPRTRRGLAAWRRRLEASDERLPADWASRVAAWSRRDHILEMPLHPGFFLALGVEDWRRFEEVMYLTADAPGLVREMLEARGELVARMVERVLADVEIDLASVSEPIGGNDRPLLSPRTYREVVLPGYRPIIDALRRGGVETICLVTYANARALLGDIVEAGFNCLWACEAETRAMDYIDIRREFGRDLRLIGGIDLDAVIAGEAATRREMETRVPALLADGGYIPLADGRVRANTPWPNYLFYRRLLERLTLQA